MAFNDGSQLDPSQVDDRRGRGPGGTVALGGGALGIVAVLVALFLGIDPSTLGTSSPTAQAPQGTSITSLQEQCQTGADANARTDCRVVGFVNSIQAYWTRRVRKSRPPVHSCQARALHRFNPGGCGYASAAVGPFYCPRDKQVYLDLSFFDELHTRFGAQGGAFAEGYVVAHEYGHHVQDLTGTLDASVGADDTGPKSGSVQTELQADCLAGVWMKARHRYRLLEAGDGRGDSPEPGCSGCRG